MASPSPRGLLKTKDFHFPPTQGHQEGGQAKGPGDQASSEVSSTPTAVHGHRGFSSKTTDEVLGQSDSPKTPTVPRGRRRSNKGAASGGTSSPRFHPQPIIHPTTTSITTNPSPLGSRRASTTAPQFAEQLAYTPQLLSTPFRTARGSKPLRSSFLTLGEPAAVDEPEDQQPGFFNLPPGPSKEGFLDVDSCDFYRGAAERPLFREGFPPEAGNEPSPGSMNDSALESDSSDSSSSSSSSTSSNGTYGSDASSGLFPIGRRMSQAANFVGERLRRRRSSASSTNSEGLASTVTASTVRPGMTNSEAGTSAARAGVGGTSTIRGRKKRSKGRRSRRGRDGKSSQSFIAKTVSTLSMSGRSSSPDRKKKRRKHVPTRREFSLMLPGPLGEDDLSGGMGNTLPPPILDPLGGAKSVAFADLPTPDPLRARHSITQPSPMLDPNAPAPPPAISLDASGEATGVAGVADWRSRLITTPSLHQVMDRIRIEREKSGYEEAFLKEREVREMEIERRRERERRKREGKGSHRHRHRYRPHRRHRNDGSGHKMDDVAEESGREEELPVSDAPKVAQPPTETPPSSNTKERPAPSAKQSILGSLLSHAADRRSGEGSEGVAPSSTLRLLKPAAQPPPLYHLRPPVAQVLRHWYNNNSRKLPEILHLMPREEKDAMSLALTRSKLTTTFSPIINLQRPFSQQDSAPDLPA